MHIGLIGYGSIGARHARLLLKYTKRITILSQRRDVPNTFHAVSTWDAFAEAEPFDVIFVTNETALHAVTITKALWLKPRALFIEKPLALNARQAAVVAAAIQRSRTSVWVGYCLQWLDPLMRAKRMIAAGTFGRIQTVRAFVGQDLRDWRTRDYRKGYSSHAARGGGVLLDLIHETNYPAWLLGEPLRPVAAYLSRVGSLTMDAETLAESTHLTPSGVVVQVHQDCLRRPGRRTLEIIGSKGTLWWDSLTGVFTVTRANGRVTTTVMRPERDEMYTRQLAAFMRMLRSGKRFSHHAEAVQDLRVVDRIRRHAART